MVEEAVNSLWIDVSEIELYIPNEAFTNKIKISHILFLHENISFDKSCDQLICIDTTIFLKLENEKILKIKIAFYRCGSICYLTDTRIKSLYTFNILFDNNTVYEKCAIYALCTQISFSKRFTFDASGGGLLCDAVFLEKDVKIIKEKLETIKEMFDIKNFVEQVINDEYM